MYIGDNNYASDSDYVDDNDEIFRSPDTPNEDYLLSASEEFSENENANENANDTSINYHSKYPFIPLQLIIPFNLLHEFVDTIDSNSLLKIPSPPPLPSLHNTLTNDNSNSNPNPFIIPSIYDNDDKKEIKLKKAIKRYYKKPLKRISKRAKIGAEKTSGCYFINDNNNNKSNNVNNNNNENSSISVSCQTDRHKHYVTSTQTYNGKITEEDLQFDAYYVNSVSCKFIKYRN